MILHKLNSEVDTGEQGCVRKCPSRFQRLAKKLNIGNDEQISLVIRLHRFIAASSWFHHFISGQTPSL